MDSVFATRRAGVLLHPSSLPGPGRRGGLGAEAYRFVDWLVTAGFSVWQTLPLGPTDNYGSPYCQRSTYAGDPRLIELASLPLPPELPAGLVWHGDHAGRYRSFAALASLEQRRALADFVRARRRWLLPYGEFELASTLHGGRPWWEWGEAFRNRERRALAALVLVRRDEFRGLLLEQYLFALQWTALKRYANERGVLLFGDLPFYVDRNSVEVWCNRGLFELDASGEPLTVAGVPPDYFNADGQLWGNPLYDWDAHERTGFRWWLVRIAAQLERFDLLRIDHFRALEAYWAVPVGAVTARDGQWRPGRGDALLSAVRAALHGLPLVAEDLGLITDDVRALRDRFELPGMVVLQFAFDGSNDNPNLPQHHRRNAVVYTGTHDNDTTVGWYRSLATPARAVVQRMLQLDEKAVAPDFLLDAAYASNAALAVLPLQDLLGLDSASRMNTPGTVVGNWRWRFEWSQLRPALAAECRARAERAGRLLQRSERYNAS